MVGVLSDGAVEPAVTDSVLLSSASVEASNDQVAVLLAVSQIFAVGGSSQEAGDGTFVGAEDSDQVVLSQQGVGSVLNVGSLGGSGDSDLEDDGGSSGIAFSPLVVADNSDSAVLSSDFLHLVDETGGTAGNGSGDSVLRQASDTNGSVSGSSLHLGDQVSVLAELLSSDSSSCFVVGIRWRMQ